LLAPPERLRKSDVQIADGFHLAINLGKAAMAQRCCCSMAAMAQSC